MRQLRRFLGVFSTATILCLVGVLVPSHASIGDYSQVIRLRQEKPISGSYVDGYRDVILSQHSMCGRAYCYPYTRGAVHSKLRTYRVVEDMYRYDMYIVTADLTLAHSSGTTGVSNMYFNLSTSGTVVDYSDTSSKSGPSNSCQSVEIGISKTIGPFSAGAKLGKISLCSESASLSRTAYSSNSVSYKAHHFNKINMIRVARVVKVARGVTPTFKLNLEVRKDQCANDFTSGSYVLCTQDGGQYNVWRRYGIGTTPA